jgi:hypothetical protein
MKLAQWLTIGSVLAGLAVIAMTGTEASRELWLGMVAPLVVVNVTWVLTERIYRRQPERLTAMMISALAGKLVFFGAYVALVIGVMQVRPVPFIASFTAYFITLHMIEALSLKRLFVS